MDTVTDKSAGTVPKNDAVLQVTLIKTKPPKQIPQRENHLRMSFLYQLSMTSALQSNKRTSVLSRMYNKNLMRIQKKSVLKLSPHMKRTICKKCDRLMVDGLNGELELKGEGKAQMLEMSCLCGAVKRFPVGTDPEYKLFIDRSSIQM